MAGITSLLLSHCAFEQSLPAGVKVMEGVCVEKVMVEKERVTGVLTDKGEVKCEVFVNCGGQVQYINVASQLEQMCTNRTELEA